MSRPDNIASIHIGAWVAESGSGLVWHTHRNVGHESLETCGPRGEKAALGHGFDPTLNQA